MRVTAPFEERSSVLSLERQEGAREPTRKTAVLPGVRDVWKRLEELRFINKKILFRKDAHEFVQNVWPLHLIRPLQGS